jgi:transcriptional regulator with XRE-family HTH domain
MANELSLTPAAYRKIETGETKLTLERLFQISEILIENFYQENKEVYEKLIAAKDEQIEFLKSLLEKK